MDLQIGNHIQKIRLMRGYSQKYMAYKLGISIPAYSKLEKKRGNISVECLLLVSEILKVPLTFIVEFDAEQVLISAMNEQETYNKNFTDRNIDN